MIIRKFTRIILGAALGISVFAFAGNVPETAYAANMSDISVTSTREDVQQVVDDGNFDYTELDGTEIDHIYELYNNDPETIKQLQRQSDYNATGDIATLSARYTHSSMFDGYKVIKGIDVSEWNGDNINWKRLKPQEYPTHSYVWADATTVQENISSILHTRIISKMH